jgi:hypothetical protein
MDVALPLVIRAIERIVVVFAGLLLLYIGFVISKRRTRANAQGEVSVQYKGLGGLVIRDQGPGFLAMALGAALLAFSLSQAIEFRSDGKITRFFAESAVDRNTKVERIGQLRYVEQLCRAKALPPAASCDALKKSRISLATFYFPQERTAFEALPKETAAPSELDLFFGD